MKPGNTCIYLMCVFDILLTCAVQCKCEHDGGNWTHSSLQLDSYLLPVRQISANTSTQMYLLIVILFSECHSRSLA
jgi:hypothetical protein